MGVSPSQFRGRPTVTTYLYDDQWGGGRLDRVVASSPWSAEDRALMLAWRTYQDGLCPGCGHPKATAWHHHNDQAFAHEGDFVCWACTAAKPAQEDGSPDRVKYPVVVDTTPSYDAFPLDGLPQPLIPED